MDKSVQVPSPTDQENESSGSTTSTPTTVILALQLHSTNRPDYLKDINLTWYDPHDSDTTDIDEDLPEDSASEDSTLLGRMLEYFQSVCSALAKNLLEQIVHESLALIIGEIEGRVTKPIR